YTLTQEDIDKNNIASGNVKAGDVCPAIIVRTWGTDAHSAVNLRVFTDGPKDIWVTSASYNPEVTSKGRHWHWPPRES
ncbi:MAG: hypothetical protein JNL58_32640, partial [Planctomyces sp.]|nr:hypothetical protein [Planctomyces sp.]